MLSVPSTMGMLTAVIGLLQRSLAGAGAWRGDCMGCMVGAEKLLEVVCCVSGGGVPKCTQWAPGVVEQACWWGCVGPSLCPCAAGSCPGGSADEHWSGATSRRTWEKQE